MQPVRGFWLICLGCSPGQGRIVAGSRPAVGFSKVSLSIEGHPLVSDLDLEVVSGEILILLGRSGSGKTSTLKLVNGLFFPDSGVVRVADIPTTEWDPIKLRRSAGYVIQEVGLFPHLTIERNIGLVPRLEGWDADRVHQRVLELLDLVGLDHSTYASRYPDQLSGGQRQRVGVARALAADPPLLLMDEPFGALDPMTRRDIQQEFLRLQRRFNKTVILVTHDVREAFSLATRIGILEKGRLIELGTPRELMNSESPQVGAFLEMLTLPPEQQTGTGEGG